MSPAEIRERIRELLGMLALAAAMEEDAVELSGYYLKILDAVAKMHVDLAEIEAEMVGLIRAVRNQAALVKERGSEVEGCLPEAE